MSTERVFHFARYRAGKPVGPTVKIRTHDVMDAYRRARLADPAGRNDQLILHAIAKPELSR